MRLVEYIWLDSNNKFRSKIRVFNSNIIDKSNWNYDGSSTGQADAESSEIILKPKCVFNNPLLKSINNKNQNLLFVCDSYKISGEPLRNNHRYLADKIFEKNKKELPWFGLEQEYFMYRENSDFPLDYTIDPKQGEYYCNPLKHNKLGMEISEEHLNVCCLAGIKMSGINAEVAPGQWEFQVGPCIGIEAGDHMMASRYFLEKIAKKHGVRISYDPKPFDNINGSGCHVNFSTLKMRSENGIEEIIKAIDKLRLKHSKHMDNYGENNHLRMNGKHETSSYDIFTYGIGTRNTSIRVGNETYSNKKGYLEDRRPASNIDPYLVTSMIFETVIE
jgi:glutamine synthetase